MPVAPDPHLMSRVASGDRQAVGELYDRYVTVLLPVALRILGNRADAEDAIHDVFVSLPERARHYAPERGSVAAWLVILARNMCLDRTRRRAVRQAHSLETFRAAETVAPPGDDPEATTEIRLRGRRVKAALDALPPAQRATLMTAFFEGLSYPEIAARDGVSLGTVKSRAARAITALREALSGDGPMEPVDSSVRRDDAP